VIGELLRNHQLNRFTTNTPQDVEAVYRHLDHVRVHGYDVCDDELDSGVWAAAAPIVDANGRVHGSLTLGAPAVRLRSDDARAEVINAVKSGAGGIAKLLMAR
jgi:DNA-binding IclR family transcriptional regulator